MRSPWPLVCLALLLVTPASTLADDYRLSAVWQLMTPVWQAAIDLPPVIWWSHLERAMLTVDDLDCRALLG